jgi:hypothetical protein
MRVHRYSGFWEDAKKKGAEVFTQAASSTQTAGSDLLSQLRSATAQAINEQTAPLREAGKTIEATLLPSPVPSPQQQAALARSTCPEASLFPKGTFDQRTKKFTLPSLQNVGMYDPNCIYRKATSETAKRYQEWYQYRTNDRANPKIDGIWGAKTEQALQTMGDPYGAILGQKKFFDVELGRWNTDTETTKTNLETKTDLEQKAETKTDWLLYAALAWFFGLI